jgi:hypothetical protein
MRDDNATRFCLFNSLLVLLADHIMAGRIQSLFLDMFLMHESVVLVQDGMLLL